MQTYLRVLGKMRRTAAAVDAVYDLCEKSVHMPRPAEIQAHYEAWCKHNPVQVLTPAAQLTSGMPPTPDQAWSVAGAAHALGLAEADPQAEAEARQTWLALGSSDAERRAVRIAQVRSGIDALISHPDHDDIRFPDVDAHEGTWTELMFQAHQRMDIAADLAAAPDPKAAGLDSLQMIVAAVGCILAAGIAGEAEEKARLS